MQEKSKTQRPRLVPACFCGSAPHFLRSASLGCSPYCAWPIHMDHTAASSSCYPSDGSLIKRPLSKRRLAREAHASTSCSHHKSCENSFAIHMYHTAQEPGWYVTASTLATTCWQWLPRNNECRFNPRPCSIYESGAAPTWNLERSTSASRQAPPPLCRQPCEQLQRSEIG